jgi:hypothetical protein
MIGAMQAAAKSGNTQLANDYARKIRAEGGLMVARP